MPDSMPPGDRRQDDTEEPWFSAEFMVVVVVGVGLLWLAMPLLGLWAMGDCYPSPGCDAYHASAKIGANAVGVILLANTAAGLVAFVASGWRWAVIALLLVSCATAVLCAATLVRPNVAGTVAPLSVFLPGALVLAAASTWRLRRLRATAAQPAGPT